MVDEIKNVKKQPRVNNTQGGAAGASHELTLRYQSWVCADLRSLLSGLVESSKYSKVIEINIFVKI